MKVSRTRAGVAPRVFGFCAVRALGFEAVFFLPLALGAGFAVRTSFRVLLVTLVMAKTLTNQSPYNRSNTSNT